MLVRELEIRRAGRCRLGFIIAVAQVGTDRRHVKICGIDLRFFHGLVFILQLAADRRQCRGEILDLIPGDTEGIHLGWRLDFTVVTGFVLD